MILLAAGASWGAGYGMQTHFFRYSYGLQSAPVWTKSLVMSVYGGPRLLAFLPGIFILLLCRSPKQATHRWIGFQLFGLACVVSALGGTLPGAIYKSEMGFFWRWAGVPEVWIYVIGIISWAVLLVLTHWLGRGFGALKEQTDRLSFFLGMGLTIWFLSTDSKALWDVAIGSVVILQILLRPRAFATRGQSYSQEWAWLAYALSALLVVWLVRSYPLRG